MSGHKGSAWTITPVEVLAVVLILVVVFALLRPAVQSSSSSRTHPRHVCRNNLKMIGLALHNYHDAYGSFPPAVVADPDGRPIHSWRVLILPFLEKQELYDQYQFDEPWNGPRNLLLHNQMPDIFACPAFAKDVDPSSLEGQHVARLTNYVAIVGPDAVFDGASTSTLKEISAPGDQTLVVAEVCQHAVNWLSPQDVTVGGLLTELRRSASEETANHVDGLHTLRVDGSVRFVPHDVAAETLDAAISMHREKQLPVDF